jgi:1-acyl-sn-glycerol-3-phosphate acyltransferase
MDRLGALTLLTSPRCFGIDRIPEERPLLLVGNHTLYGVLDVPFLMRELYLARGIFVRVLGDHAHFRIPLWGRFLTEYGVVDGTPKNCAALLEAGQVVLVFPGGGREVAKRRGEKYRLLWKERLGFARMAIAHQALVLGATEN